MSIEEMAAEDWAAVARIYEQGLDLGTFEDSVPSWRDWDATHLASPRLVAREGGTVVGWAAVAPVSQRECYRGVGEHSIYVATEARGRGIGRALLRELCRRADAEGIWTLQAHTFADNHASIALHQQCGFRFVGVREQLARKHGAWRDTVLLERRSELIS